MRLAAIVLMAIATLGCSGDGTKAGNNTVCKDGESCGTSCSAEPATCNMSCLSGSNCNATCNANQSCSFTCEEGATCDFNCANGSCSVEGKSADCKCSGTCTGTCGGVAVADTGGTDGADTGDDGGEGDCVQKCGAPTDPGYAACVQACG